MKYEITKSHRSNYPNPITLSKGQVVRVGKRYEGPENWPDWLYCTTLDQTLKGWVPEQIIRQEQEVGVILEAYTAKELDVEVGEAVVGSQELNGWVWCQKLSDGEEGWVPQENMSPLADSEDIQHAPCT
ncbi:SH3 domain-containing protein [Tumebacillus lipolyticus]|uniref:SH3 domain-containing protein n=1 Tax=Tumebacillus lipolyticus TaxID=1280370 RepID=A0ABW5A2D1_9BACL